MTTEVKVTEELFQQALKASGSFEIARSNAERVSMRRGFELGMQYARHHQADDATVERVNRLIAELESLPDELRLVVALSPGGRKLEAAIAAMREDG